MPYGMMQTSYNDQRYGEHISWLYVIIPWYPIVYLQEMRTKVGFAPDWL